MYKAGLIQVKIAKEVNNFFYVLTMPTVLGFSDILAQLSPTKPGQSTPRASAPSTSGSDVMGEEDTSMEDSGTKYCSFLVSCGTNYCTAVQSPHKNAIRIPF